MKSEVNSLEYVNVYNFNDLTSIHSRKAYRLACDIDCKNERISKILENFVGTIDGNGYSIKNLIIEDNEIILNSQPVALFHTMNRSIVKNLKILNLKIEVPKSVYNPEIAALCVEASDTLFENVYVEAAATYSEKLPLVYDSNNCEYVNIELSNNMIRAKFE